MKQHKIIVAILVAFLLSLPFWAVKNQLKLISGESEQIIEARFYEEIDLPEPKKDNYNFAGWYSGQTKLDPHHLLRSMTLEARYEPKTYHIIYDFDGASHDDDIVHSYVYGQKTALPVLEKENYNFQGYTIDDNESVVTSIEPGVSGNIHVAAVFEPKVYTITFHTDEGTLKNGDTLMYIYGQKTDIPSPEKKGYIFKGWYTDEDLSQEFIYDESLAGDLDLYARYEKAPVSSVTGRVLSGPYVSCGSYSAALVGTSNPTTALVAQITDGPGAYHDYQVGKEYIADHNYQGGSAFVSNDTLKIVREDGTVDNYVKVSTNSITWSEGIGVGIIGNYAGELITQTCVGNDIYFCGWNKQ